MKKRIVMLLAFVCLLSACGKQGSSPKQDQVVKENHLQEQQPPDSEPRKPMITAPLTGLEIKEPMTERPLEVMVNNHAKARPQSGLSKADVLYEILAEGEITRIVAIFQSQTFDGAIGPVRSIRPYFIDIGKSHDAILIHAGGSPDGYKMLSNEGLDHLDEITNAGPYFWRDRSRKAPHNLYTNLAKLKQGIEKKGFRTLLDGQQAYPFLPEEAAAQGEDAGTIDVTFLLKSYQVTYQYEPGQQVYKRFINNEPHTDLNNGEQLSAANVAVLEASHRILDNAGRRSVDLSGSGKAVLFQRGKAQQVEWRRERTSDWIRLYKDGAEVGLYPGQTHFLIIPDHPGLQERLSYAK